MRADLRLGQIRSGQMKKDPPRSESDPLKVHISEIITALVVESGNSAAALDNPRPPGFRDSADKLFLRFTQPPPPINEISCGIAAPATYTGHDPRLDIKSAAAPVSCLLANRIK